MRRVTLLGTLAFLFVLVPVTASAELSDDIKKELRGYVEKNLPEGDVTVKRASLLTLGHIGGEKATEKIAEYKTDDALDVRLAAGLALWQADQEEGLEFVLKQLKGESDIYPLLVEQIGLLDDEQEIELLEKILEEGEAPHKKATFRYLSTQHGELYDFLTGYIDASDEAVRTMAINAIRSSARPEAFSVIREKLLGSDDAKMQTKGLDLIIAMSRLTGRTDEAMKILEKAVDHDNAEVAEQAAIRLLEMHDTSGVDRLVELLGSTDKLERKKRIIQALLDHDVSPPAEPVKKLYKEAEEGELKERLFELAVATGDDAMWKKIEKMWGSTHFDKRLKAAKAMGYSDERGAIGKLGSALFEGNPKMRLNAARSLRQIADPEAVAPLKRAISQERDTKVKVEVIRALGAIGTDQALQILRFNSRARQPEIRRAIVAAIRDAGKEKGVQTLKLFFGARDLELQWLAFVTALDIAPKVALDRTDQAFRSPPDGFMADLEELPTDKLKRIYELLLVHDNDRVRNAALRSAQRVGEPMYDLFRSVIFNDEAPKDVRLALLTTLSEAKTEADTPRFEKVVRDLSDEELINRAAWTLVEIGSDSLEATFRGYIGKESATLRALGALGLARIKQ